MSLPFSFEPDRGTIHDRGIRYLMMRPDVLMGAVRSGGAARAFVQALEDSAFANAQGSFAQYLADGLMVRSDFIAQIGQFAATLGWGSWSIQTLPNATVEVCVHNSPFAAGFGSGDHPVCGPIAGVLRAAYMIALNEQVRVDEVECACQGAENCRFHITRAEGESDGAGSPA